MEEKRKPERRAAERRWERALFYLVERRKGNLWMYGSIILNVALLAFVAWLLLG
jgi:hypothetical protein